MGQVALVASQSYTWNLSIIPRCCAAKRQNEVRLEFRDDAVWGQKRHPRAYEDLTSEGRMPSTTHLGRLLQPLRNSRSKAH